jgi:hypothetical protein
MTSLPAVGSMGLRARLIFFFAISNFLFVYSKAKR